MKPELIAISGPLEGVRFNLDESETGIGRDPSNRICLPDVSVSRQHCVITYAGQEVRVRDLGSRNLTFVNGLPVQDHLLRSGDRLRIGDSVLLFLMSESETDLSSPAQLTAAPLITRETVQLRRELDPLFSTTLEQPTIAPETARSTRDLNALLKISLALNSIRNLEAFQQHLLPLLFEIIPASRGAILLTEDNSGNIASVFGRHRIASRRDTVQVSKTVVDRVIGEGAALLCNDVSQDAGFANIDSLSLYHIQALVAAPLMLHRTTLGLIYLDTPDPEAAFDEDHLQLLRAVASIAAVALDNLRRIDRLETENLRLQAEIRIEHDMVGQSAPMREVYAFIGKVAPTDSTVLINGESGTGKELAARAIHCNSRRAAHPFVAINCATLTEPLLESEIFGHEKGAFTGAVVMRKGKIELAEGGTLFLDEIAEMAPSLQSKLLRVLQEREFTRLGGTRTIKADIRLIAATNRDLEEAIKQGAFREDLFYRLNVIRLTLPPLRERRDDILPLAYYFAARYGARCNRRIQSITPEASGCLLSYHWPGNVREFENAIERAIVLGSTDTIRLEDLPENVIMTGPAASTASTGNDAAGFYDRVKEAKKRIILQAFNQAQGSYLETARLLGMHPNHLHRLIRNLDMKAELKK